MNLKAFAKTLRTLPITLAQNVASKVAPDITTRARAAFAAGQDPYGVAWAPGVNGQAVTLYKSGRLGASLLFVAVGTRVRAVLSVPYAKYQIGKRAILPPGGKAMPAAWSESIGTTAKKEIESALARAA